MSLASLAALLNLTAALLTGVQNNTQTSPAAAQQAVAIANQTVQLSTQAMATIPFAVPRKSGIWTNIDDVKSAPYLDFTNRYTPLGKAVSLIEEDTSFGDLNNDGFDDAAVVVQRTDANGATTIALAAVLNQSGSMFNIADLPLGKTVEIFSHHVISNGIIELDIQADGGSRAIRHYQLIGNQIVEL